MVLFTQMREQIVGEKLVTDQEYRQLLEQFMQEAWREDFVGMNRLFTFTARPSRASPSERDA